jgi:Flp pilus assembly protein TadD
MKYIMEAYLGNHNRIITISAYKKPLLIVFLLIATFAVFWQSTDHQFVIYDDNSYVTDNLHVKAGLTYRNMLWAFTTMEASNWHPITWFSHMVDAQLFGMNPAGHHLTSVFLHVVNTFLLFFLFQSSSRSFWKSFALASLFGLHPLHVESVAWVAERKDVLSTLFWLLTMFAYDRYASRRSKSAYAFALISFALGLMAKPMLVTLPFVLLLWDLWPLRRYSCIKGEGKPLSFLLLEKVPFFILTAASCVITYHAQEVGGAVSSMKSVPWDFRLVNALVSYWDYVSKFAWPRNLAIVYPLPATRTLLAGIIAGSALMGVSAVFWYWRQHYPSLLVGWAWFLGTLVPVIGLVQVGEQAMADRYTYIPSIGFFLIIVWGVSFIACRYRSATKVLSILTVAACIALASVTWIQVGYWHDSVTLFSHATKIVPKSVTALVGLGQAYAERKNLAAAQTAFQEALRLSPQNARTHAEWGFSLEMAGNYDEALGHYRDALRINPRYAWVHNNISNILLEKGNLNEALYHCWEAQHFDPENPDIALTLGVALATQGDLPAAEVQFVRALKLRPDFPEAHYNLGVVSAKTRRFSEAERHFAEALRINPSLSNVRQAIEVLQRRKGN